MRFLWLAVFLLVPLSAWAQGPEESIERPEPANAPSTETPSLTWVLERAEELDSQADYVPASELYEVYAEACLDTATAALETGSPCFQTGRALERAFELRRALGDLDAASRNAAHLREHFLYAEPRRALQVGYQVARMHFAAGDLDEATDELDGLGRLHPHASARQALVFDALRAEIAATRGRRGTSTRAWRRVERRWERDRAAIEVDGSMPITWVREAVAEGRLQRAQPQVDRFLATRAPRLRGVRSDARWWSRVSAWLTRSRRRLALARHGLERVYELGSVRHSVIAAARIGEMYGRQADVHTSLSLPDHDLLLALARDGANRPGYDEARSHFETCLAWSANNGVASTWAERCERGLNDLDPEVYPMQAELHGEASYHPVARALPLGVED